MELRLPTAQGGILLIRSFAVHTLSFFAFFIRNCPSFAAAVASDRVSELPPASDLPGSEEEEAIDVNQTKPNLTLTLVRENALEI